MLKCPPLVWIHAWKRLQYSISWRRWTEAIHTYIHMQRLKWHWHSTVAGALYKIIVSNSCSTVFRRRTHETVSSSVPGGTPAMMEQPWQTTAGHSRHVPLPPGRRDAMDEWHKHLRACIHAKGGHFEHLIWSESSHMLMFRSTCHL